MANITTRVLNHNIYRLKRQYGYPLELYRHLGQTLDVLHGTHVYNREKIKVRRVIVLPGEQHRNVLESSTIAKGTAGYSYGGDFEITDRVFILDAKDIPTYFKLSLQDYLIWENKRYDFRFLAQLEEKTGYYIVGKEIKGSLRYAILDRKLKTVSLVNSDFTLQLDYARYLSDTIVEQSLLSFSFLYTKSLDTTLLESSTFQPIYAYVRSLETDTVIASDIQYLMVHNQSFSTTTTVDSTFDYDYIHARNISTITTVDSSFDYDYNYKRSLTTIDSIFTNFSYTQRFMPNQILGLKCWIRPKYGVWKDAARTIPATIDGDSIGGLTDYSGNVAHFTQAPGGTQPKLKLGANGINGIAGIFFDGADDFMTCVKNVGIYTPEIYMVIRVHTATSTALLFSTQGNGYHIGTYGSGNLRLIRSDGSALVVATSFALETNYQLRVFFGRNSGTNASKFKLTGQTTQDFTIAAGDYAAGALDIINLGRFNATGHYQRFTLGELLIYDAPLSVFQRANVAQYLLEEYGVGS